MKRERIDLIKMFIYENIKILEDTKAAREDKKVARMLIREEVEGLAKDFFKAITIYGASEEVLAYRSDMKEVAEMLRSYLAKLEYNENSHDKEIYRVYSDILFII